MFAIEIKPDLYLLSGFLFLFALYLPFREAMPIRDRNCTLYPVKRLSENIAVSINPKFKEEIKNRREKEVKELHEQEKNLDINKTENHSEQKEEKNDEKNVKSEKDIKQIDNSENKSSQKNSEVTKELNQIKEKEGTSKNEEKEVKGINTENPSSNKDHDEEKESGKEKKN